MLDKNLTTKTLQQATGAPIYVIQYLKACNRLPIAKESKGRGYPTYYKPNAVNVIKKHMAKQK